jgi:predicted nucleotide-binding protein
MTEPEQTAVLLALSAATKKNGWFPAREHVVTRENRPVLDALVEAGAVSQRPPGHLCLRQGALRQIRDRDPFAKDELDRAVQLLKFLQELMTKRRPGPHVVEALQQGLKWPEPNDARRASHLLWLELNTKGIRVSATDNEVPQAITVDEYIWDANPDLLQDGEPPHVERPPTSQAATRAKPASRRVFIVHGHDREAKEQLARVLERLGLAPVILHEQPNRGRTIIEKFEANAEDIAFAVALLTPDDVGAKRGQEVQPRARENVLFEAGYFVGALGRHNVVLLRKPEVAPPSDLAGVLCIEMDEGGGWIVELAKELRAAGVDVDLNLLTS